MDTLSHDADLCSWGITIDCDPSSKGTLVNLAYELVYETDLPINELIFSHLLI